VSRARFRPPAEDDRQGLSNPQYWTYQEKVISWAFDSVTLCDYNQGKDVQAFADSCGSAAYQPVAGFCSTTVDNCDPQNGVHRIERGYHRPYEQFASLGLRLTRDDAGAVTEP
jgi:hypothetical protein